MMDNYLHSQQRYKAYNEAPEKTDAIKRNLQDLAKELSANKSELQLYKKSHPGEFSKLMERMNFSVGEKCTPSKNGAMVCSAVVKKLADIREEGLDSGDLLYKILTDPNGLFADQKFKIQNDPPSEDIQGPTSSSADKANLPIKDQVQCNLKALDAYKEEISKVRFGYYYGISRNNGISTKKKPCFVLDVSFKIDQKPFKRTLLGGTIIDMEGNIKSLNQSDFDGVLSQWGILKNATSEDRSGKKSEFGGKK